MSFTGKAYGLHQNVITYTTGLLIQAELLSEHFPGLVNTERLVRLVTKLYRDHFGGIGKFPPSRITSAVSVTGQSSLLGLLQSIQNELDNEESSPIYLQCQPDLPIADFTLSHESLKTKISYSGAVKHEILSFDQTIDGVHLQSCICMKPEDDSYVRLKLVWSGPFDDVSLGQVPGVVQPIWMIQCSPPFQSQQLVNALFFLLQASVIWGENRLSDAVVLGDRLETTILLNTSDEVDPQVVLPSWLHNALLPTTILHFARWHFEFFADVVMEIELETRTVVARLEKEGENNGQEEKMESIVGNLQRYMKNLTSIKDEYQHIIHEAG